VRCSKGALLEAQGQFRDALDLYRDVLRYHPGHKKATLRRAEVERRLGIVRRAPRRPASPKPARASHGATSEHKRRRPRTSERRH